SGGASINLVLGSAYSKNKTLMPFLRGSIHHNQSSNALLSHYDAGSILAWMGGPIYIYSNTVKNPYGCRNTFDQASPITTFQRNCYGAGIYLDSNYKAYVFNNIISADHNDINSNVYSTAGINEAMGFNHMIFNNAVSGFVVGLHKGMLQHNRNYYFSNTFNDIGFSFVNHKVNDDTIEYESIAFTNNLFIGSPKRPYNFGRKRNNAQINLTEFSELLSDNSSLRSDVGEQLKSGYQLTQRKSIAFIPWSLYSVVGEWNFYKNADDPENIFGENFNLNAEWLDRTMFHQIARNNLSCEDVDASNFTLGILENWIKGAIIFDGDEEYCSLDNDDLGLYSWRTKFKGKSTKGTIHPSDRDTIQINRESFIIEAVLKPGKITSMGLLSKHSDKKGFTITLQNGYPSVSLASNNMHSNRLSSKPINDNKWHHLLVEVDRNKTQGINIYIDGILSNGVFTGSSSLGFNIANNADFEIGRSGNMYY
ncbi:hypothetical protein LCGC14_2554750, partial [marine sediment metagenome]